MNLRIVQAVAVAVPALLMSQPVAAQTDATNTQSTDSISEAQLDSIESHYLDEITVEAPKVVRKSDMDVYYPSHSAIAQSKNGMQLLRNLMIPSVTVNEMLGTVTSTGASVQLRINGRTATVEQVQSLDPESIKRIEWIDDPGIRYKGATTVMNIITVNPTAGGSFKLQAAQALNVGWGQNSADLKLNFGRSQWGISGGYSPTNKLKSYREYYERFTYPDGRSVTRTETPVDGYLTNNRYRGGIYYSYVKPDTTVLWISVDGYRTINSTELHEGVFTLSDGSDNIRMRENSSNHGFTPYLSVYFEQNFAHRQTLMIDASASLYNGSSIHDYTESIDNTRSTITDTHTMVRDCNASYAVEADYVKSWNTSRLTAGLSYNAARNRTRYSALDGDAMHQHQDNFYAFAEYFQRINKVTFTAGIGASYSSYSTVESGIGEHSWNIRPRLALTYRYNDASQFRASLSTWQNNPTLSQTNTVAQPIDGIQWRLGNPNLSTYSNYRLQLSYQYSSRRINGRAGVWLQTSPDAITTDYYWQDDRLINSYENSKGFKSAAIFVSPQIEVVPDWFTLSAYLEYDIEHSKGRDYNHTHRSWNYNATAMVSHWGFTFLVQYNKGSQSLWGEKITSNETSSTIGLSYQLKNWEFMGGMIMPFGRYDQGTKLLNKYYTNESHTRLSFRMPVVMIRYNIQWGRQRRNANRGINSGASAEQSSAAGR